LPNNTSSLTVLPVSCLRDLATEDAMAMTKLREEGQSRLLRCCLTEQGCSHSGARNTQHWQAEI